MASDKVVGELIKGFSSRSIESAKDAVSYMEEKTSSYKVPYFVTDEDTKKYIKELGLDNPQKLFMFLVEVGFSVVEVVIGSINEIQIDIMNDVLSGLESNKQKIMHILSDNNANEKLKDYQDDLNDLRNKLEIRVKENIQRIVKIDKMSSFERKIKAAFIRNNVDLYTQSAQVCLQAVMEIAKIQIAIANYIGDNNFAVIQRGIDKFMYGVVFRDNNISLMNDWSTKGNRNFWSDKLRKEYENMKKQQEGLQELFADLWAVAEKKQVDLENIIFE